MKNILTKYSKKLSPTTQGLLLFPICNLILNLFLGTTGIGHTKQFLRLSSQGDDSWKTMFKALEYLHSNHEVSLYSQLFFNDRLKFQYPLTSLLPLQFLEQFTSQYQAQLDILKFLSWLAVIVTAIFTSKIFNISSSHFSSYKFSQLSRLDILVRSFTILSLCFMFYPLIKAYTLGQIQVFINCFFAIAAWFWIKRKEHLAGILIGLVILIKPQYLLIAIWGLLRKRFRFSIPLFTVCLSGFVCSLFSFGISSNLDYFRVIQFISRTGECYYPNQTMNGLLNRFLFNGNNLQWDPYAFAPFNPIVYAGTLLSSALLIFSALFFVRKNLRGSVTDFMIIALSCTLASPVAWEHHYGILPVIFAFLLPHLLISKPGFKKRAVVFFVLSYTLASNYLPIFNLVASIPVLNIAQSYLFIAALTVLVFLYGIEDKRIKDYNLANTELLK